MRLAVRPLVVGSFDEFAFLELSARLGRAVDSMSLNAIATPAAREPGLPGEVR